MKKITLYGTTHCHLCEQAYDMLNTLQAHHANFKIEFIDIAEHDALNDLYALNIPVVSAERSDSLLFWPFDTSQLNDFIQHNL